MAILWQNHENRKQIGIYRTWSTLTPELLDIPMNRISLILTALMMVSIMIFWAPGVLAMNRGKLLQTIALWLAIFLALALIYKNFGPDSPHPLFNFPGGMTHGPRSPEIPADKDPG